MKYLVLFLCACSSRTVGDVRVTLEDGRLRVERAGRVVLDGDFASAKIGERHVQEAFGAFRFEETVGPDQTLVPTDVRPTRDGLAFSLGSVSVTDDSVIIDWTAKGVDRVIMRFVCADGERFFGLGAQISVEHTGRRVPIWVSEQGIGKKDYGEPPPALVGFEGEHYDSYTPIPFALSSARRGLFLDSSARAAFELCTPGLRVEADGAHMRLRVFFGASMGETLAAFSRTRGASKSLPLWTYSPWVDVFGGPTAIREATALLRARGTPVSAVWAEDWVGVVDTPFGENLSYDWEADTARFPDIAALTRDLHADGFRFLTYMNPYLALGTRAHDEALKVSDGLGNPMRISFAFGAPLFLADLSTEEGVAHYRRYKGGALALGIDGWMADYGEALPYDAVLADGRSGAEAHNDYPRMWADANDGVFTFMRSSDRGSIHWLGDQRTSFDRNDGLGSVMPLYLSSALSGIALTHSDVGGYTSDGQSLVRDDELFSRWLALEAFTPVLRTHHGSAPARNVQWNSNARTLALFDVFARWHQRLLPYFAAQSAPAVRPIWLDDDAPGDEDQEALVGHDLLLAPIVERGATSRAVSFPSGTWWRWRTFDGPLEDAQSIADATLDEPVVYLRAGAVIPLLLEDVPSVNETMPPLMLLAVSGGSSEGEAHGMRWSFDAPEKLPRQTIDVAAGETVQIGSATLTVSAAVRVRIE